MDFGSNHGNGVSLMMFTIKQSHYIPKIKSKFQLAFMWSKTIRRYIFFMNSHHFDFSLAVKGIRLIENG